MIDHIINIGLPILAGLALSYICILRKRIDYLVEIIEVSRKELSEELRRRDDNV